MSNESLPSEETGAGNGNGNGDGDCIGAPFRAVLTPHRSLSPTGFLILMTGVGLVSFIAGVAFLMIGAWPVLGFFGLDVLIIYVAFRRNYRAGRRSETIEIDDGRLTLTRVDPRGRAHSFELNPYWVRVLLREGRDGRTHLALASHGRVLSFGAFLTDDERRDLAETLRSALLAARGGPRI